MEKILSASLKYSENLEALFSWNLISCVSV